MGATRVGKEEEASEWRRGLKFKLFNCDTFVSCESSSGRFLAPCGRVNPSSVVRQQIFRFSFVWGVTFGSGLFEKTFFCVTVILSYKIVLKIYYFFQKALFKCDPTNVSQLLYLFRFGSFFENKKKKSQKLNDCWTRARQCRGLFWLFASSWPTWSAWLRLWLTNLSPSRWHGGVTFLL